MQACLPHKIFISITESEEITDKEGYVIDAIAYWNNNYIKKHWGTPSVLFIVEGVYTVDLTLHWFSSWSFS